MRATSRFGENSVGGNRSWECLFLDVTGCHSEQDRLSGSGAVRRCGFDAVRERIGG